MHVEYRQRWRVAGQNRPPCQVRPRLVAGQARKHLPKLPESARRLLAVSSRVSHRAGALCCTGSATVTGGSRLLFVAYGGSNRSSAPRARGAAGASRGGWCSSACATIASCGSFPIAPLDSPKWRAARWRTRTERSLHAGTPSPMSSRWWNASGSVAIWPVRVRSDGIYVSDGLKRLISSLIAASTYPALGSRRLTSLDFCDL